MQDASVGGVTFALSATASTATASAAIDLGADTYKPENVEIELSVPALTSVHNPAANTEGFVYVIETSTTSSFAAVAREIASKTVAGSTGPTAAQALRCRLPGNCERYLRGKVTPGATAADASAVTATVKVLF